MTKENQRKDKMRQKYEELLKQLYPDLTLGQARVAFSKRVDNDWENLLKTEQYQNDDLEL